MEKTDAGPCPDCELARTARQRIGNLDADERAKLRRRIEDAIRKNPAAFTAAAAALAAADLIQWEDLC